MEEQNNVYTNSNYSDKTTIGIVFGIILGVFGLAIGILMYPKQKEKDSFMQGWAKGVIGSIVITIVLIMFLVGNILEWVEDTTQRNNSYNTYNTQYTSSYNPNNYNKY